MVDAGSRIRGDERSEALKSELLRLGKPGFTPSGSGALKVLSVIETIA